jgi:hypothetical protein
MAYAGNEGHHGRMEPARPLAPTGSVFLDARGDDRALRITWHSEVGVVVLSLWRENVCAGSFRVAAEDVPALIASLRAGLAESYAGARDSA